MDFNEWGVKICRNKLFISWQLFSLLKDVDIEIWVFKATVWKLLLSSIICICTMGWVELTFYRTIQKLLLSSLYQTNLFFYCVPSSTLSNHSLNAISCYRGTTISWRSFPCDLDGILSTGLSFGFAWCTRFIYIHQILIFDKQTVTHRITIQAIIIASSLYFWMNEHAYCYSDLTCQPLHHSWLALQPLIHNF